MDLPPPPVVPVLFEAVSTPPRSFRPHLFGVLAVLSGSWALGGGLLFALRGAWPVLPFLGVETLATLGLVLLHHRWSARAREVVRLSAGRLEVRRVDGMGRRMEAALDPYWARVELAPDGALTLVQRRRRVPIGYFLSEAERESLAETLREVLAAYRSPVFDNPQLREPAASAQRSPG